MRPTKEEIAEYGPAIEGVLADAAELQRVTARIVGLTPGTAAQIAGEEYANELVDRIRLRAERDGLDSARLIELANARIADDRRFAPMARAA